MGVTGMTAGLLAEEATCAVCGRPVRAVVGTPSRQEVGTGTTGYALAAWCRLDPCGHTFTVRRGGLIY